MFEQLNNFETFWTIRTLSNNLAIFESIVHVDSNYHIKYIIKIDRDKEQLYTLKFSISHEEKPEFYNYCYKYFDTIDEVFGYITNMIEIAIDKITNTNKKVYDKPLFCILGETCSGKDTTVRNAIKIMSGTGKATGKAICSYTTRPKRDNETEGVEHYFVSKDEFANIKSIHEDDVLAYTKIGEYEYMALINELDNSNIYIIDPLGLKDLRRRFGERITNIVPIYITASLSDRCRRAKRRSDYNTSFKDRVISETEQFLDFLIDDENKGHYEINTSTSDEKTAANALSIIMHTEIDKYHKK